MDRQWRLRLGVFWLWPSAGDSNKCNTEEARNQKSKWPWIATPSLWLEGIRYVQRRGAFRDKLRGKVCGWSSSTIGSTSSGFFLHADILDDAANTGKENVIMFIFFILNRAGTYSSKVKEKSSAGKVVEKYSVCLHTVHWKGHSGCLTCRDWVDKVSGQPA